MADLSTRTNAIPVDVERANGVTRPWVVIGFILIPVFIGSLDLTVVSAFLPKLIAELGLPFDTALDDATWMVTGYLLAYTISLTFMGRLSDLYGRRAIYVGCLLTFIVGSVITALAGTPVLGNETLTDQVYLMLRRMGQRPDPAYVELQVIIVGRVIAALGAGALVPVSLALVGDLFPPHRRAQPLGLIGAVDTLGWVLGPVYGAIFLRFMPWQGLFLLNVPLTLLTLFAVLYALRRVPQLKAPGSFDLLGTILIGGALSALTIGLGANIDTSSVARGLSSLQTLPTYALPVLSIGAIMFLLFVLLESRLRHPLIRPGMFRKPPVASGALINLFIGYVLFIGLVSVPVLINVRAGDTTLLDQAALEVGLVLSTLTIPMAIATVPGGWLSERIGAANTVRIGLSLALLGYVAIWLTWTLDIGFLLLAAEMAVIGVGIGFTFSPISASIINNARDDERGVAGAVVLILRLVGMTLSVSSLSSLMLNRVNTLANERALVDGVFDAAVFAQTYAESAVTVLREIGLVGAILCAVAILPTRWLSMKKHDER
ncbi:MAG: MFS transporter [Anaerolineae bacterium]